MREKPFLEDSSDIGDFIRGDVNCSRVCLQEVECKVRALSGEAARAEQEKGRAFCKRNCEGDPGILEQVQEECEETCKSYRAKDEARYPGFCDCFCSIWP